LCLLDLKLFFAGEAIAQAISIELRLTRANAGGARAHKAAKERTVLCLHRVAMKG